MSDPKRISLYPTETLQRVLDARTPRNGGLARTRSSLVTAILDRYDEIVRRDAPEFTLPEWLLIFEAMNGCWLAEPAALAVNGVALSVADADRLDGGGAKWKVPDAQQLARRIEMMPFASRVAILDAAERFWSLGVQPSEPGDEAEPWAHWRGPVRAVVGRLADDPAPELDLPLQAAIRTAAALAYEDDSDQYVTYGTEQEWRIVDGEDPEAFAPGIVHRLPVHPGGVDARHVANGEITADGELPQRQEFP